jgi:hypothetical protein
MRIPGVYIPEFAKLSPEDRMSLIRRCEESDEMRHLYAQTRLVTWVSVPSAAAITVLLGRFVFLWSQDFVWALATFLSVSCLAASRFFLLMGKARLIRHEATKEREGNYED